MIELLAETIDTEVMREDKPKRVPILRRGVLLAVGLVFAGGLTWIYVLMPKVGSRPDYRRIACKDNLKNIGLGLHNYHVTYGSLPPAYVADEQGRPMHSWRVLLLPFIDNQALYKQYDFSVPWDNPNNWYVLEHMPGVYCCPDDPDSGGFVTSYLACSGPNFAFQRGTPIRFSDITDGLDITILVGEATGLHVPWTKPQDVDVSMFPRLGEPNGISSAHAAGGGAHVLFGDNSVLFVTINVDPEILRLSYIINDGNKTPYY